MTSNKIWQKIVLQKRQTVKTGFFAQKYLKNTLYLFCEPRNAGNGELQRFRFAH